MAMNILLGLSDLSHSVQALPPIQPIVGETWWFWRRQPSATDSDPSNKAASRQGLRCMFGSVMTIFSAASHNG